MNVEIKLTLDVGEQDSTSDAIEVAQQALVEMDFAELVNDIMSYKVID